LNKKKPTIEYPDSARRDGITPPKGILLVGMPGCGKSLSAKATASLFKFPLLRLDIGSLMGKYVGESEDNLRRALSIAEQTSPCVLWVDELEKAFAGISGDGTGITARLFGSFLTWLQEKNAPVFVFATANDISMLRPELLRRGRFDEIFYVKFPNESERKQIFKIHIDKLKIAKEDSIDCAALAQCTEGYAGSDIEALVNNAAEAARNEGNNLSTETVKRSMKYMTPLKQILGEQLAEYEKIFKKYNMKSASDDEGNTERLDTLTHSSKVEERVSAAKDEFNSDENLLNLAKDSEVTVRRAILDNT
jgi:SpoVK/Ycf46/Vps4 family AAA+-type ATPase